MFFQVFRYGLGFETGPKAGVVCGLTEYGLKMCTVEMFESIKYCFSGVVASFLKCWSDVCVSD